MQHTSEHYTCSVETCLYTVLCCMNVHNGSCGGELEHGARKAPCVMCVSLTSSTRARDAGKKVMNTR